MTVLKVLLGHKVLLAGREHKVLQGIPELKVLREIQALRHVLLILLLTLTMPSQAHKIEHYQGITCSDRDWETVSPVVP